MTKIQELKFKLKVFAETIRMTNAELKDTQKSGCTGANLMYDLFKVRYEARHHHIAYCELRGRTRDQIEQPRKEHAANEHLIAKLKQDYAWEVPATEAG